jgi:hypothetical protein
MPKVFGMHEIELQPELEPEDYERFSPKSSHRRSSFRDGRPIFQRSPADAKGEGRRASGDSARFDPVSV